MRPRLPPSGAATGALLSKIKCKLHFRKCLKTTNAPL